MQSRNTPSCCKTAQLPKGGLGAMMNQYIGISPCCTFRLICASEGLSALYHPKYCINIFIFLFTYIIHIYQYTMFIETAPDRWSFHGNCLNKTNEWIGRFSNDGHRRTMRWHQFSKQRPGSLWEVVTLAPIWWEGIKPLERHGKHMINRCQYSVELALIELIDYLFTSGLSELETRGSVGLDIWWHRHVSKGWSHSILNRDLVI